MGMRKARSSFLKHGPGLATIDCDFRAAAVAAGWGTVESKRAARISRTFFFGPFVLMPERRLLLRGETALRIGGRALDILTVLVEQPGETIGKRELMARVWPGLNVEEENLKVNVAALRRALADTSANATYIVTESGRGYRFIAPVRAEEMPAFGQAQLAAAPDSPNSQGRRHNLPISASSIFGRDETIAGIGADLEQGRLISIVGAGGVGKTTVALAIAERLVDRFAGGIWLVDLSPLKDAALVPNAIAAAIGLTAQSANMLAALSEFLREREMLLVLDNCEHLIDAVAFAASRLLADAASVKILATSREALAVRGERVRRLSGLPSPPDRAFLTAAQALAYPAVQLFADRAADSLEGFTLSDADAPIAAEICRRLDGLALAIELAATRVDVFGVGGISRQLDDRLRLPAGMRDGPERHRTLTATIDWSYELLSENERALLRRLSVFAGPFSLASACAVAIDEAGYEATNEAAGRRSTIDALASLVAKSLVAAEAGDGEMEYRLLAVTRGHALEKLGHGEEFENTRRRHAAHLLDIAEEAKERAATLSADAWLARYAGKIDDLRDALRWAFERAGDDAAPAVRLTIAAIPFWKALSLVEECRVATERALEARFATGRDTRQELILLLALGATTLHTQGPVARVGTALEAALAIAGALDDTVLRRECLRGLSQYAMWIGDSRRALAFSDDIRALAGTAGDADAQAGHALSWLGDLPASQRHLEKGVNRPQLLKRRPDAISFEFDQQLPARGSLASVQWLQGFPDRAMETARRQREEAEASYDAVSLCYALLHGSAIIALYVRDYDAAKTYIDRGVDHATRHGLTFWRALSTSAYIRWQLYTGQQVDVAKFRTALEEVRDGGFRMRYPNYLTNYGEALARQGDLETGLAAIDEAIALSQASGHVVGIPEILRIKGNVIRFQAPARWQEAAECYRESIELARRDGALSWELRSAASLVTLTRRHGANAEAETMLSTAYARFTEGFSTGDVRRARALLESHA